MRQRLVPIIGNQTVTVLFGVIGVILISHVVPESVYGAYGLFLTLMQVGILLTHSGLINHASRYWQREHQRTGAYARFLLRRTWQQGIALAALLLVVAAFQATRGVVWLQIWPLLVVSNVAMALLTLAISVLNASEKHWAVFGLNALSSSARVLLPILFALTLGTSLFALSLGFALHALIVAVAILLLYQRASPRDAADPLVHAEWSSELRHFGRPFVIMGVGGWLLANADRWVVAYAFGEQQLGLFTLASNMASVVPNMVAAGMLQWVFPAVFRQADLARSAQDWRKLARRCDRFTLLFLGLTVSGLIGLAVLGPFLVGPIISNRYAESMPLLLPAGLAIAATTVNQFQYLLLQGQHDSSSMAKIMMLLAGIRTVGSALAALISWPVFLGWLVASTFLVSFAGRLWIQHIALRHLPQSTTGRLVDSVKN